MKETPERHISKYTAPALGICTDLPEEQESELLERIDKGGSFTRKEIQDLFPKAYRIMQEIAKEKGFHNIWHLEVSQVYWLTRHNKHTEHDSCNVIKIRYQHQDLKIPSYLKLEKGDRVTVHLETIVEKLE